MQATAIDRAKVPAPQGAIVYNFYWEKMRRGLPLEGLFQCRAAGQMAGMAKAEQVWVL